MHRAHLLDQSTGPSLPMFQTDADVRAFEQTPYAERIAVQSTYAALQAGAAFQPDAPAIQFLPKPEPDVDPQVISHAQFMARVTQAAFAEIGDAAASTAKENSPHPLMHRTETVDYGVVIEGEFVLVLDEAEVVLKRGAVVIQRGTNHAWANRSNRTCRMLFVLVDGRYDPALAHALQEAKA